MATADGRFGRKEKAPNRRGLLPETQRRYVFDFCPVASKRPSVPPGDRPAQRCLLLIAVTTLVLITGCFHSPAPYQPTRWPGSRAPVDVLSDSARRPVLQVLIAYNVYWPNHTALRLVDDRGQALFWDPGGGYGKTTPGIVRHSDLITDRAPSLATYMVYRWSNNDQVVEIFEWALTEAEARRLHAQLLEARPSARARPAQISPKPVFVPLRPGFSAMRPSAVFSLTTAVHPSIWGTPTSCPACSPGSSTPAIRIVS